MSLQRTGAQYLEDLRDGRAVSYDGALVGDVTRHFALGGGARSIARLLDMHAKAPDDLTCVSEDGLRFPAAYMIPRSSDDVRLRGQAFRAIARLTGGLMARTPDFLAALIASWAAADKAFEKMSPRLAGNVVGYYREARARHLCHAHAISDPPTDRFRAGGDAAPLTLRKTGTTADGIVVRGMKMLATLAPIADELLVYPYRELKDTESAQALAFAIPIATPGLKLLCRPALATGGPVFDHPLAERFDEMDALCVFDDVVIPEHRVFIDGDVRFANALRAETGMIAYIWHQTACRASVKAEMVLGVASLVARLTGRDQQSSVREMLGEIAAGAEVLRSLVVSAEAESRRDQFGNHVPGLAPLEASSVVAPQHYARSIELLQQIGASDLVMHPSAGDLSHEPQAYALEYFGGAGGDDPRARIQLLKLAGELAIGAFGGRQLLYERFYLGAPRSLQARLGGSYERTRRAEGLVRDLLSEKGHQDP